MSLRTAVRCKVRALRALGRRFCTDRRGTIAVFIAASAIPLIGALGLATDVARGYLVKSRLHQALDAAALAGGKDITSQTRDADIQKFFTANFPSGYMDATLTPLVITPDANNTSLTVSASATVPTTFMRVLGYQNLTVAAETEVKKVLSPALDVVLSMDLSGSMGSPMSKIEAARNAANDLVDALYGPNTTITTTIDGTTYNILNIGLVPWNQVVNITERGQPAFSQWATTWVSSSYTNPYNESSGSWLFTPNSSPSVPLFNWPSSSWDGCVYARYEDDSNNSNDADLSLGLGSLGIPGTGTTQNWVGYTPSYSSDCLPYPITPLQPSKTVIQDAIDELTAPNGATNIVQGLFWAWEVLMPGEPYDHGLASVPYPRNRAIVLLTDGQNYGSNDDAYHVSFGSYSQSAFGTGTSAGTTTWEGNLPSPPAASGTKNNLNNRLRLLAQFIKEQGIFIYVVQFDEISQTLTDLLSEVASEPNEPYYFNAPTEEELEEAFDVIAGELSRLRLSR